MPAGAPYAPQDDAPMWNTWRASPKDTSAGTSGARAAGSAPVAGRGDEEVEQHIVAAGGDDEHVATGAEAGQHRLGDERREHRRQGGVHRVAAGAQDVRAGAGGGGMTGRDDATHGRFYSFAASSAA
jgi:hypothetical protein